VAHTGFDDAEDPQTMDQIMTALGAAVVDWPYKTECCGAALATSRPDIGGRMIYEVIQNAKEAGAECIITACPLCMLNLDMRQAKVEKTMGAKFDMPVYYITEMVALAGGYSPEEIGVPRHFVEAMGYLNSLPEKAAALAAQEEAQKPKKAVKKAESGNAAKTESAAPAAADEIDEKALQKKIEAIFKGIQKNPEKIAARMIEDPERAQVLAELMADDKKSLKIAELLVTDKDKAAKVAEAFVTGELKKREK
jgi:heterodisulfide reductase subunit B